MHVYPSSLHSLGDAPCSSAATSNLRLVWSGFTAENSVAAAIHAVLHRGAHAPPQHLNSSLLDGERSGNPWSARQHCSAPGPSVRVGARHGCTAGSRDAINGHECALLYLLQE
eukprot:scpid54734/ scgid25165/ 